MSYRKAAVIFVVSGIAVTWIYSSTRDPFKAKGETLYEKTHEAVVAFEARNFSAFDDALLEAGRASRDLYTGGYLVSSNIDDLRAGKCTDSDFFRYYVNVRNDLTPLSVIFRSDQNTMGAAEKTRLAQNLASVLNAQKYRMTGTFTKESRLAVEDCLTYRSSFASFTQYINEYDRVISFALEEAASLLGPDTVEEAQSNRKAEAEADYLVHHKPWSSLSRNEKKYFSGKDEEVEACLQEALRDQEAARGVSKFEVADLCRNGLN